MFEPTKSRVVHSLTDTYTHLSNDVKGGEVTFIVDRNCPSVIELIDLLRGNFLSNWNRVETVLVGWEVNVRVVR